MFKQTLIQTPEGKLSIKEISDRFKAEYFIFVVYGVDIETGNRGHRRVRWAGEISDRAYRSFTISIYGTQGSVELPEGTEVLSRDRVYKKVEDLVIGDKLYSPKHTLGSTVSSISIDTQPSSERYGIIMDGFKKEPIIPSNASFFTPRGLNADNYYIMPGLYVRDSK